MSRRSPWMLPLIDGLMSDSRVLSGVLMGLLCLAGCRSTSPQETVEAESRRQSQRIRDLEARLAETERLLADQDQELQALRQSGRPDIVQVGYTGDSNSTRGTSPESLADWSGVSSVRIHRLTSGVSAEDRPRFHLVLQPLDGDRELRKVAGEIDVSITLLPAGQSPVALAAQTVSITDSRRAWTRGLVSSGFHLDVPLDEAVWRRMSADGCRLAVSASLNLGQDRVYTTSEVFEWNR